MGHNNIAVFIPHLGCPHACSFCDQKAISGEQKAVTPATVSAELQKAFSRPLDPRETEIAFFGGSFTCLPREEMVSFLKEAAPYLKNGLASGIRISTRPDGIDREILAILKRYGVTAIELGAQSMCDSVLLKNRRGHDAKAVEEASALIKEYGFSLGLQMMIGLPEDSKESLYHTAEKLAALSPDTIRLYPTVVLQNTLLAKWLEDGSYRPLTVEEAVELTAPLIPFFEEKGIRVIRVGLHASGELEAAMLGGGYHPAFRELCESRLFLKNLIKAAENFQKGRLLLTLSPKDVSIAAGQKRQNMTVLSSLGYGIVLKQDKSFPRGEWTLTDEKGVSYVFKGPGTAGI